MNAETTVLVLVAIVGGILLFLVRMSTSEKGHTQLKKFQPVAEIVSATMLVATAMLLYVQLSHIQDQNELQRNVASKSAIQDLNEVILGKDNKDFLPFLFPNLRDRDESDPKYKAEKKEARETMMAFSLMNSLEMLYLTQRNRVHRDDFKCLLDDFTTSVHKHWKNDFPTVYHPDFQKIVKEVFDNPPKCPKPNEEKK